MPSCPFSNIIICKCSQNHAAFVYFVCLPVPLFMCTRTQHFQSNCFLTPLIPHELSAAQAHTHTHTSNQKTTLVNFRSIKFVFETGEGGDGGCKDGRGRKTQRWLRMGMGMGYSPQPSRYYIKLYDFSFASLCPSLIFQPGFLI